MRAGKESLVCDLSIQAGLLKAKPVLTLPEHAKSLLFPIYKAWELTVLCNTQIQ